MGSTPTCSGTMTKCLYCGKLGSKRKQELPEGQRHMACRDEYSDRKWNGRCVVCNEEDVLTHLSCGGDDSLPGTGYPRID